MCPSDDRGAVTVEAALALCSVVLVVGLAVSALSAAAAALRCQDGAREAARLVARGEPGRARLVADSIAPVGARVDLAVVGDEVTATVTANAVSGLPALTVSGRAVGVLEPGALLAGGLSGSVPAQPDPAGPDPPPGPDPAPTGSQPEPTVGER
jgi:hypothetical protein